MLKPLADRVLVKVDTEETGDRVLFAKYSGVDIEENGQKFLLLSERDVLGIL